MFVNPKPLTLYKNFAIFINIGFSPKHISTYTGSLTLVIRLGDFMLEQLNGKNVTSKNWGYNFSSELLRPQP